MYNIILKIIIIIIKVWKLRLSKPTSETKICHSVMTIIGNQQIKKTTTTLLSTGVDEFVD